MGLPERGDLVVVAFPFSDLSGSKLRPALVVGVAERGDLILCQVTSRRYHPESIELDPAADLPGGKLHVTSYARPLKLFTADARIIKGHIGTVVAAKLAQVTNQIVAAVAPSP